MKFLYIPLSQVDSLYRQAFDNSVNYTHNTESSVPSK